MSRNFDLKEEIEKYTSQLTCDIMSLRRKKEVKQEYTDHIEDAFYHYQMLGFSERDAFNKACEDIGEVKKVRFLLAEVHNNKLQLFVVNKILNKLHNYFTGKKFIKALFVSLVVFCIVALLCLIYFPFVLRFVINSAIILGSKDFWWRIFKFVLFAVSFFSLIYVLKIIFSVLCYFVGRIIAYIRICFLCLVRKHKFSILRLPFVSLLGLNRKGDFKIVAGNQTYRVHFIDIVLKYRRELTVLDDNCYAVSKVLPNELRTYGATLIDGESWFNLYVSAIKSGARGRKKVKNFPPASENEISEDIHIIIVQQDPVSKFIVRKNNIVPLSDGDAFGGFINYSFKSFADHLKRL